MRVQLFAGAALVAFMTTGLAQAQNGPSEGERNWAAIAECAKIAQSAARHACMDGVVQRAGVLDPAQVAQATRQDFGREERAAAPPPVRETRAPTPAAPPELTEVATTIQAVRTVGYQRLRVTTAEGSVWEQTQAESFNTSPKVGDSFSIERTQLGGYRCRFARASRYYCQRMD